MNDLISRQQAIKALNTQAEEMSHWSERYQEQRKGVLTAVNIIVDCPSVQPDIIYCKDCKHHWTYKCMDGMPIENCDLKQTFYDANIDYCSLAERREK